MEHDLERTNRIATTVRSARALASTALPKTRYNINIYLYIYIVQCTYQRCQCTNADGDSGHVFVVIKQVRDHVDQRDEDNRQKVLDEPLSPRSSVPDDITTCMKIERMH